MIPTKSSKPASSKDAIGDVPDAVLSQLSCLICKQQYPREEMSSHLARVHADYHPHKCIQCDFFSVSSREMGQHAEESKHRVVLNEEPDDYKADFVKRLLADCWKKANGETPYAFGGIDEKVSNGQASKTPVGWTITCQLPGCGAKLNVPGPGSEFSEKMRHIEVAHVRCLEYLCPVESCPKSRHQPSKRISNRRSLFELFDGLDTHVKELHILTPEMKAAHVALKTKVERAVAKLRYKCFPPEGKVALAVCAKKMKTATDGME